MYEPITKQSIEKLEISEKAIEILKRNKIKNISQLCKRTKTELKDMCIVQKDIRDIEISLQLVGLDLKNSNH